MPTTASKSPPPPPLDLPKRPSTVQENRSVTFAHHNNNRVAASSTPDLIRHTPSTNSRKGSSSPSFTTPLKTTAQVVGQRSSSSGRGSTKLRRKAPSSRSVASPSSSSNSSLAGSPRINRQKRVAQANEIRDMGAWKRLKDKLLQVTRSKMVTNLLRKRVSAANAIPEGRTRSLSMGSFFKHFGQSSAPTAPTKKVYAQMPRVLKLLKERERAEIAKNNAEFGRRSIKPLREGGPRRSTVAIRFKEDHDDGVKAGGGGIHFRQTAFGASPTGSTSIFGDTSVFGSTFCEDDGEDGLDEDDHDFYEDFLNNFDDGGIEVFSNASRDELLNDLEDLMLDEEFGGGGAHEEELNDLGVGGNVENVSSQQQQQHEREERARKEALAVRQRKALSHSLGQSSSHSHDSGEHGDAHTHTKQPTQRTPYLSEMKDFVPMMRDGIVKRATDQLRLRLYPVAVLRARRKNLDAITARSMPGAVRLSPQFFKVIEVFSNWPANAINELIAGAVYRSADNGEAIIYEGEPFQAGVYLITAGNSSVSSQTQQSSPSHFHHKSAVAPLSGSMRKGTTNFFGGAASFNKRASTTQLGLSNSASFHERAPLQRHNTLTKGGGFQSAASKHNCGLSAAPLCFGESLPLTEEPHRYSVRAINRCDVWRISVNAFRRGLDMCSPPVRAATIEACFIEKNEQLQRFPMNPTAIKQYRMFALCQDAILEDLCRHIVPYCVPRDHDLCVIDDPPKMILFVTSGTCALKRKIDGEMLHVANVRAGGIIGDTNVLHDQKHKVTITTTTRCDCWALPKASFDNVTKMAPSVTHSILHSFREARREQMLMNLITFRDRLLHFPLLDHAVSVFALRDLVRLFEPKVYPPMSVLCSTSTYCNTVIVLLKGTVTIGSGEGVWRVGEVAGFTGIVPHRWRCPAICHDTVETLELNMDFYEAFLRDSGAYEKVRKWCLHLMFPKAFSPEDIRQTAKMVKHLKSPILYPVSTSRKVAIPVVPRTSRQLNDSVSGVDDSGACSLHDERAHNDDAPFQSTLSHLGFEAARGETLIGVDKDRVERQLSASGSLATKKQPFQHRARTSASDNGFGSMTRSSSTMWVRKIVRDVRSSNAIQK